MTKISIVTISDGNTKALKKTLNSIDNQNYKNFKNLIVTKENLKNLDKKYKKKNRFFYYKKNSYIYEAMNYGLKKSVNNFLIFLNSGDQFISKSSLKKISNSTNNFIFINFIIKVFYNFFNVSIGQFNIINFYLKFFF